jgi:bacteriocin biosynthesis cyclodehydratase domain-containing protein
LQPLLLLQLLQPLLVKAAASSNGLPTRPALAPWYRVVPSRGRVLLEHAGSVVTLEGRGATTLLPALLPLLDGTRSIEQLVGEVGPAAEPAVLNALALLARHGLLLDGPAGSGDCPSGLDAAALFVAAATRRTSPTEARAALAAAEVGLTGSGGIATELARLLDDAGLRVAREPLGDAAAEFVVAAPAAAEVRQLHELNDRRLRDRRAWLQALPPDGRSVVVGPVFLPGLAACHTCYRLRRGACSDYEDDFDAIDEATSRAASPTALLAVAAGIAAVLVLRWLAARDPTLPGRFYAFETGAVLGLSHHHLLRVPRCPSCGDASTPLPAPWYREAARAG